MSESFRKSIVSVLLPALCLTALAASAAPATDATLALASFDARGGATEDDAALCADILTATLVNDGKVRVVERTQIAKVMKEQALAASGMMSDAVQIKIAQLVGAHWVLVGSLQESGRTFVISGRAIDSSTGQVAFADTVQLKQKSELTAGARQLAHKMQDALVGGSSAASAVDDFDVPQLKEAARQLAQQIAVRFPKIEGRLGEVLPDNTATCRFADPKAAFAGQHFLVAGHDSVMERETEKGIFLITSVSEKGCSGRVKRTGGDEVSNGDLIRSMPLKVSMAALAVGAGTDPQVGQILSQETRESLKNQPTFVVSDDAQVSFIGRIGGARGHRVIEVQALDKTGAVLQRWDLTGLF
jgi:TolB-like protein